MKRLILLVLSALLPTHAAAQSVSIHASGSVRNPGAHALPAGSRLSAAALMAAPDANTYLLGAALLRERELAIQIRLKAGLLFDLDLLRARQDQNSGIATTIDNLHSQVEAMPVTGRIFQLLAPRSLEAQLALDTPVLPGDRLHYPSRPDTVTVTGAVSGSCRLAHVPLKSPAAYRSQCPLGDGASPDHVYVIQPDGHIQKHGIALWNRDRASSLAPGAIVFVPLADSVIHRIAPDTNEEAARFLATQVLDALE